MEKVIAVRSTGMSKSGKSKVLVCMDNVQYYLDKSITQTPVVGLGYTITYEDKPYKGNSMLWISKMVSQNGTQQPATVKASVSNDREEKTDWIAKERRELRKTIWDTVFMTIYKENKEKTPTEICTMVSNFAEAGFAFTITKENDIDF